MRTVQIFDPLFPCKYLTTLIWPEYHTVTHAADVVHAVHFVLSSGNLAAFLGDTEVHAWIHTYYIYIYIYICDKYIHACMYVCIRTWIVVHFVLFSGMYVCMHTCMHEYIYANMHIQYVCFHACTSVSPKKPPDSQNYFREIRRLCWVIIQRYMYTYIHTYIASIHTCIIYACMYA